MEELRILAIKYQRETQSYMAQIKTPVVLRVNQESRYEGLQVYRELRLGSNSNIGCYLDPTRDSVYLSTDLTAKDYGRGPKLILSLGKLADRTRTLDLIT